MPEYLAPGVYVEETSFRAKSIEGVGTSTTGFVGLTRTGPTAGTPELLTSFADFERIYGGLANLTLGDSSSLNYLAHAVRAYFNEGGSRLYVARVFIAGEAAVPEVPEEPEGEGEEGEGEEPATPAATTNADGLARSTNLGGSDGTIQFIARFPGTAGNGRVTVRQVEAIASSKTAETAPAGSLLRVGEDFYVKQGDTWVDDGDDDLDTDNLENASLLTLTVTVRDADGNETTYEDLGFDRSHPRWIGEVLSATPSRRADALQNPYAVDIGDDITAFNLQSALAPAEGDETLVVSLTGGNDGVEPNQAAFEAALEELTKLEDISIVAAPGSSALTDAQGVRGALITHAETQRYRIAVLDTPADQALSEVRTLRSQIDSTYAALYYPWVIVSNPLSRPGVASIPREIALPPSGFVCGIYARNDVERGVFKAPANEVVRSALRFEQDINFAQQESLNPLGINCLRYLTGRGYRVWGARTVSSDPEWKYVNVRRYFNYLKQSIDRGTQWAVFEPNGERLWANVRDTVAAFLYNEWVSGALLGGSPQEAFFVRCDRSTMTQNDLDNGRLICLIGVAVLKPAEFVIFRIGQKTADARS